MHMSADKTPDREVVRLREHWDEVVRFVVTIIKDGNCRANHKVGERFEFSWRTPEGICSESFVGMYPIIHSLRVFGDMRELGSPKRNMRIYKCPSREVHFQIEAVYCCNLCGSSLDVRNGEIESEILYCKKPEFPLRVCKDCYEKHHDTIFVW